MSINKPVKQFNLWCCASTLVNNARFSSCSYAKLMQSKQLVFHITCTYSQQYYKVNQSYNKILKCDWLSVVVVFLNENIIQQM